MKTLNLYNRITELERLSAFIETLAEEWSLPPQMVIAVNLALEEAFSNVVFYGYDDKDEHRIRLEFALEGQELRIILIDDAKAYDPTARKDPDTSLPLDERQIGGLGILLIRKLMDRVEYQRRGNENRLCMVKVIGEGV